MALEHDHIQLGMSAPHFYHRDRVIVLYLGSDAEPLALLQELLGPLFAGK